MTAMDLACVIRQREARDRKPRLPACIAPMPTDPLTCRWCRGALTRLPFEGLYADYCSAGCAPDTDTPPYVSSCQSCSRYFPTGQPHAVLCWECSQHQQAEMQARAELDGQLKYDLESNAAARWRRHRT